MIHPPFPSVTCHALSAPAARSGVYEGLAILAHPLGSPSVMIPHLPFLLYSRKLPAAPDASPLSRHCGFCHTPLPFTARPGTSMYTPILS
jgi:hypothetical protein